MDSKRYRLTDVQGAEYESVNPGQLGGHRRTKIYGKLDCISALSWISRGHYVSHRVFFADEYVARAAGYRPCAVCMLAAYAVWKQEMSQA